ncbi:LuxR C-terminal-related transcriptional regulator [Streptomyces alfalfae]|uniref:DNA-binding protein n=1 Tax=Streptomyces alfalfae TaxID=1642299 RepID=A0A7T4U0X7_9ACTN|nr:LuxR C-terminal-related transcriptional regulator [Streptomyces alfalfae]QQC92779.1 DNA-binding protein [Streptomyces alfalfae]
MTTTMSPTTPLTETEKAIAAQLAAGLDPHRIAARRGVAPPTIKGYLKALRLKLHCPGAPQHILVHAILSARQAPQPTAPGPAPDVTPEQAKLWRALAAHKVALDVAQAAGIAPADVKGQRTELLSVVGANDLTQLVVLGHAWGQLNAGCGPADASGAGR